MKSFWLECLVWLLLLLGVSQAGEYKNGLNSDLKQDAPQEALIHVAVVVDRNSLKDFLMVLQSAVNAAKNPSRVVVHAVAVGINHQEAVQLKAQIVAALENCLAQQMRDVVAFVLPDEGIGSGFKKQLHTAKKRHHWTSPAGADMVRFFLPSLFPQTSRLLYMDNDIIVSCCLDEIYNTDFGITGVVGLALDDLKWATATQFKRHYNNSHPLVIKNMRRAGKKARYEVPTGQQAATSPSGQGGGPRGGRGKNGLLRMKGGPKHGPKTGPKLRPSTPGLRTNLEGIAASISGVISGLSTTETKPSEKLAIDKASDAAATTATGISLQKSQQSVKRYRNEATTALVGPNEEHESDNNHTSIKRRLGMVSPKRRLTVVTDQSLHPNLNPTQVDDEEFMHHLPRYPNDGVLLFNTRRYNIANILKVMDDIARANAEGDYVVNLGTQQFTVLALWDRWVELSPRANLRHFPDMARGYMMWFLYNGLLHYAGAAKPAQMCAAEDGYELRRFTYTAWVTTLARSQVKATSTTSAEAGTAIATCNRPEPVLANYSHCIKHLPVSSTIDTFMQLMSKEATRVADDGLLHLRFGPVSSGSGGGMIDRVDSFLLHNASWSWRLFDADEDRLSRSKQRMIGGGQWNTGQSALKAKYEHPDYLAMVQKKRDEKEREIENQKGRRRGRNKLPPEPSKYARRSLHAYNGHDCLICDGTVKSDAYFDISHKDNKGVASYPVINYAGNIDKKSKWRQPCADALGLVKSTGNMHWDVISIVIDYPVTTNRPLSSSVGVLTALRLDFMRPKFVVVVVYPATASLSSSPYVKTASQVVSNTTKTVKNGAGYMTAYGINDPTSKYQLEAESAQRQAMVREQMPWYRLDQGQGSPVQQAKRFLVRHGYLVHSDDSKECRGEGSQEAECVWGTLLNNIEMYQ